MIHKAAMVWAGIESSTRLCWYASYRNESPLRSIEFLATADEPPPIPSPRQPAIAVAPSTDGLLPRVARGRSLSDASLHATDGTAYVPNEPVWLRSE